MALPDPRELAREVLARIARRWRESTPPFALVESPPEVYEEQRIAEIAAALIRFGQAVRKECLMVAKVCDSQVGAAIEASVRIPGESEAT